LQLVARPQIDTDFEDHDRFQLLDV
jgi:hypothetical protein